MISQEIQITERSTFGGLIKSESRHYVSTMNHMFIPSAKKPGKCAFLVGTPLNFSWASVNNEESRRDIEQAIIISPPHVTHLEVSDTFVVIIRHLSI